MLHICQLPLDAKLLGSPLLGRKYLQSAASRRSFTSRWHSECIRVSSLYSVFLWLLLAHRSPPIRIILQKWLNIFSLLDWERYGVGVHMPCVCVWSLVHIPLTSECFRVSLFLSLFHSIASCASRTSYFPHSTFVDTRFLSCQVFWCLFHVFLVVIYTYRCLLVQCVGFAAKYKLCVCISEKDPLLL